MMHYYVILEGRCYIVRMCGCTVLSLIISGHSNAHSCCCRYFALVQEARRWFDQFAVVSEVDLEDFDLLKDTADPGHLVKRFRVSRRCSSAGNT